MYKSFLLTLFDYADIIWDNCTDAQSSTLENLHLEDNIYELSMVLSGEQAIKNCMSLDSVH